MAITQRYVNHDAIGGDDGTVEVPAGGGVGPWTLAEFLTQATGEDTVNVKKDADYNLGASDSIDGTGIVANNTYVYVRGYKNNIGDMSPGGLYYGGAVDALREKHGLPLRNPLAKWVIISGGGGAFDLLTANAKSNIIWENITFSDVNDTANNLFYALNPLHNWRFNNCRFEDARYGIYGNFHHLLVDDCYFGNLHTGTLLDFAGYGTAALINSIVDLKTNVGGTGFYLRPNTNTSQHCTVFNNLFIGGGKGVQVRDGGGSVSIYNNTFDLRRVGNPVSINSGAGIVSVVNNIMICEGTDQHAVVRTWGASGSLTMCDYNLTYSLKTGDVGVLTNPYYTTGVGAITPLGDNNIEANPQFVDRDNYDYTVGDWQFMEEGKPDAAGKPRHIGYSGKPSAYDIIVAEEQV